MTSAQLLAHSPFGDDGAEYHNVVGLGIGRHVYPPDPAMLDRKFEKLMVERTVVMCIRLNRPEI